VVISTPFLGAFNDYVEIYAKKNHDKIILSDDGITLKNLNLQGISVSDSSDKKDFFDRMLLTYEIKLDNDEFIVEATDTNFAQKKQSLIEAIYEINKMYMKNETNNV